jgi:hypothetical protein
MTLADQLATLAPLSAPTVAVLAGIAPQSLRVKRSRGGRLSPQQMAHVAVALRRLTLAAEGMADG